MKKYVGYLTIKDIVNNKDLLQRIVFVGASMLDFPGEEEDRVLAYLKYLLKSIISWRGYDKDPRIALNQLFVHVASNNI